MYKKVELKNGFVGMENEVAEMWKQKNIIKKNFEMNKGQIEKKDQHILFMMDLQQLMESHMLDTSKQE